MLFSKKITKPIVGMGIVFCVLLILYIDTLMPGTVGGDAGEVQSAAPLLALVHPIGQPIYLLLGKIWTIILPLPSTAYELNLLAAVSTAGAGAAIAWYLGQTYSKLPIWFAVLTGLLFGIGGTVWSQAVLADKYGFTALVASLIVGSVILWDTRLNTPQADRYLYMVCVFFSLGLLHHQSLYLFGIGIALLVLINLRQTLWQNWQRTLRCLALTFLPPLLIYPTLLSWYRARNTGIYIFKPDTVSEWRRYFLSPHVMSNRVFVFDSVQNVQSQFEIYTNALLTDYTYFVVGGALLGLLFLLRRRLPIVLFLFISFLSLSILSANFRGPRQFTYYIPSFVVLAYGFGMGIYESLQWFKQTPRISPKLYHGLSIGLIIGISLIGVNRLQYHYPDMKSQSEFGEPLGIWRSTLKSGDMGARMVLKMNDLPSNAVLAADWEQVVIFWYTQQVEGVRQDLTIVYPIEEYQDYLESGRPICVSRNIPLNPTWHLTNIGPVVCQMETESTILPESAFPINKPLHDVNGTEVISLAGVELVEPTYTAGQHAPMLIYWQALTDIEQNYSISLRMLDQQWNTVWSQDIQSPVIGLYETSRWTSGEVVGDYHEISIPTDVPAGQYLWAVIVYRQRADGSFENLQDSEGNMVILGGDFEVVH